MPPPSLQGGVTGNIYYNFWSEVKNTALFCLQVQGGQLDITFYDTHNNYLNGGFTGSVNCGDVSAQYGYGQLNKS